MCYNATASTTILLSLVIAVAVVATLPQAIAQPTTLSVSTQPQSSDYCYGKCWQYDDHSHTMTWTGPMDGREDVWQGDEVALARIRSGWTAIFGPMSVPGEIEACVLTLNGQIVKDACDGVTYQVPAGQVYQATSAHPQVGGFRWRPAPGYGYRLLYDLPVTPPPDGHFEIPFWVVPGEMRQINVTTAWSYTCYTPLNPLKDAFQLSSSQCTLVTQDYVHKGNSTGIEWGRNYNGIFTLHVVSAFGSDRLIALNAGENKNENIGGNCGQGGACYQNTVNTNVLCSQCSSGYCDDVYSDCWNAYNALINMSWQYYDSAHNWGMQTHNDEGPIIWPANGYTYSGIKSSGGVRHPHGLVDQDYIWAFYEDNSYGDGSFGYGIKVARAPVSSGGLPGNWQTYCNGLWVNSLPAGFDRNNISSFYSQRGGCASPILPVGGTQVSFAVAKRIQGGYLGIEERINDDADRTWKLRLWTSSDLINWSYLRSLLSVPGDWDAGEIHYPVFLSADGWHSDLVDRNDFYIVGTKNGTLRAMRVHNFIVLLPVTVK